MVDFNKGSNFVVAREDTGYFFFIKKKDTFAIFSCQRHIRSAHGGHLCALLCLFCLPVEILHRRGTAKTAIKKSTYI